MRSVQDGWRTASKCRPRACWRSGWGSRASRWRRPTRGSPTTSCWSAASATAASCARPSPLPCAARLGPNRPGTRPCGAATACTPRCAIRYRKAARAMNLSAARRRPSCSRSTNGGAACYVARARRAARRAWPVMRRLRACPNCAKQSRATPATRAAWPAARGVAGGAQQAFDLLGKALLGPGSVVAVENPGYPLVRLLYASHGAQCAGGGRTDGCGRHRVGPRPGGCAPDLRYAGPPSSRSGCRRAWRAAKPCSCARWRSARFLCRGSAAVGTIPRLRRDRHRAGAAARARDPAADGLARTAWPHRSAGRRWSLSRLSFDSAGRPDFFSSGAGSSVVASSRP